jgi:hypothetical protein
MLYMLDRCSGAETDNDVIPPCLGNLGRLFGQLLPESARLSAIVWSTGIHRENRVSKAA